MSMSIPQIAPTNPSLEVGDNPLVTVIIPTYNYAAFVAIAVESALNQSFIDYEIIVVDDGSTDNTRELIARYGSQIKYIWQENQGLSAARNTGIQAASGKYIALLDADDSWMPGYLAEMIPQFENGLEIGAVYCGWGYIDGNGNKLPRVSIHKVNPDQFSDQLAFSNFLVPSGVIVRRSCFDEFGLFDEAIFACEDRDMWYRISSKYEMVGVPKALVAYRLHGDNMTANVNRMEINRRAVIEKNFGVLDGYSQNQPGLRRRAFGGYFLRTALDYFQVRKETEARGYLKQAFEVYPELSDNIDTFYEMACIYQPIGVRGLPEFLDLSESKRLVFESLETIFNRPDVPMYLSKVKNRAYSNAWLSIALLSYNNQNLYETRDSLLNAARIEPQMLFRRSYLYTLVKAFLPGEILQILRKLKRGVQD